MDPGGRTSAIPLSLWTWSQPSSALSYLPTLGCTPNSAPTQTDSLLTESKPGDPDVGSWSEDAVNPIG